MTDEQETPDQQGQVTAQQVVDGMKKIRERRSQLKKEFEEQDRKLREQWERGESWLMRHMQETGHKSFKVDGATVFTSTQTRYKVPDKEAFKQYLQQTGNLDLVQLRVNTTNMRELVKETENLPPGVDAEDVVSVNIRKS